MMRWKHTGKEREQVVLRFREKMPVDGVREAWRATIDATEALRLGIRLEGDVPGGLEPRPPQTDLMVHLAEPSSWDEWLRADRRQDFDWEKDVPWRAAYWPATGRWVWTFHHALLDGRSITRILRAFLQRLSGEAAPGFVWPHWQAASSEEKAAAQAHFTRLSIPPPGERLDFAATGRGRAARVLGEGVAEKIHAVAQETGVTPAAVILWAWGQACLLATGGESTLIGQVRAGAPKENTAGFSMNTLPVLVTRDEPEAPATQGWRALRQQMLALRACEALDPQDLAAMPAPCPSAAAWESIAMIEHGTLWHQLGGLAPALLESALLMEDSSSPLLASAWLRPDLRLEVEADAPLGQPGAEALADYWEAIICRCADLPAGKVGEITALPAAAAQWLAAVENGGPVLEGPAHLAEAWRGIASTHENRSALWSPEENWTYAEVHRRAETLATDLRSQGVQPGHTVAVHPARRSEWLVALVALALLGAVYLPLGRRIPPVRLRAMVEDSRAEVLAGVAPENDDLGLRLVPFLEVGLPPGSAAFASGPAPAGQPAPLALLYTSGSTGQPKGVPVEHHGALNEARWVARALGLGPGDRLLQFAAPGFDASLEEMLACLLSGATLVPRPEEISEDLSAFHTFLETAGITALDLPTAFWSEWTAWMKAASKRVPARIKATIIGGERASALALADWREAGGGILWNSYGPTEASIVATAAEISAFADPHLDPPIGRPLPGCLIRVASAHGSALPPGAIGEIWIGGQGVASGYWRRPDLTAASFVEKDGIRWYRTGDLGRWDAEGQLHFAGRRDDQVKIRGQRVEPGEAARLIESFPGVAAAHVGLAGPPENRRLAAWVRWAEAPPPEWPAALRRHVAASLPAAAIPVRWMAVESFALTDRGKLDRSALPEPPAGLENEGELPATLTERQIAGIWRGLLGVEQVFRQDSFFDLGGDSLSALRLFARLAEDFGAQLPMASLMQAPTLAQLAAIVESQTGAATASVLPAPHVVPLSQAEGTASLFCIHGGDGGVFFYRELARHVPGGIPLVTIESPALSAEKVPAIRSVEASATDYVAAILKHQAHGPYHLAGYSYGGVLVYEIAAQLRAAGEPVAFLALFDTENPARPGRAYSLAERLAVFKRAHAHLPPPARLARLLARGWQGIATHVTVRTEKFCARLARCSRPHSWLRTMHVREAHSQAMDAYRPRALDVPMVLFKTEAVNDKYNTPEDYGWTGLPSSLEIITVPGGHLDMFSSKHVIFLGQELAARLRPHLGQAPSDGARTGELSPLA